MASVGGTGDATLYLMERGDQHGGEDCPVNQTWLDINGLRTAVHTGAKNCLSFLPAEDCRQQAKRYLGKMASRKIYSLAPRATEYDFRARKKANTHNPIPVTETTSAIAAAD